jgi:hypothetical protein
MFWYSALFHKSEEIRRLIETAGHKLEKLKDREFIFIDESGIDLNIEKEYGYEMKGKRLFDERFGNKANQKRITIVSGSLNNKFIAPFRFKGYTNTEVKRSVTT